MSAKRRPHTTTAARLAALDALYEEIHAHYRDRDPALVRRQLIKRSLESDVLLLGQALARETQRLSGIPYCFPPAEGPRLSAGGRRLDTFLSSFGYTIDPNINDRAYAHHTDIAHYFPGKMEKGFGDRRPSQTDITHDREWLEQEIAIIEPKVMVSLGKEPALEFAHRYLGLRLSKLSDIPLEPIDSRVLDLNITFFAVHHPSGAFQHPSSKDRYARAAEYIKDILER